MAGDQKRSFECEGTPKGSCGVGRTPVDQDKRLLRQLLSASKPENDYMYYVFYVKKAHVVSA